jgi:hypothetical protein
MININDITLTEELDRAFHDAAMIAMDGKVNVALDVSFEAYTTALRLDDDLSGVAALFLYQDEPDQEVVMMHTEDAAIPIAAQRKQ